MEFVRLEDARAFREIADPFLLENEAANNLILGVSGTAVHDQDAYEGFRTWVVTHSGGPVAAAVQTPPHNLILALTRSEEAVRVLADEISELPGVIGVSPSVHHFVHTRPERATLDMSQGIFQLETVIPPAPVKGLSRKARPDEIEKLVQWRLAFQEEALGEKSDPELARRGIEWRLKAQSSRFGLWVHEVDNEPVSMSGHQQPTPNGIRVSLVYTPPEHRGHGYATTLVAAQSQWLLESGHRFCFLYTDLANPTSNSIYKRIGYRQIAQSAEYSFSPSA